jgi:hypothetical protein
MPGTSGISYRCNLICHGVWNGAVVLSRRENRPSYLPAPWIGCPRWRDWVVLGGGLFLPTGLRITVPRFVASQLCSVGLSSLLPEFPGCRRASRRAQHHRQWCEKFGLDHARRLKRREGRLGDYWHLDEVVVRINGQQRICGAPWIRTAT